MVLAITFTLIKILIIVVCVLTGVAYMTYAERKVIGHMQVRLGPIHTGPKGLLQPLADGLKLLAKEDMTPDMVDKPVFYVAPFLGMVPGLAAFAVIPFADNIVVADINIGVLYVLALSSLGVYGIIMAGWSSNSKYATLGSLRSSAQIISYETAMGLAILGPVILAGSLNLTEITQAQKHLWFAVPQVVAFVIYAITAVAETNRAPFDLAEGETEIVAGFHIEYSGMRFAMFFLGEYANMIVVSCMCAVLFLGGFTGPLLPGIVWFLLKTCAFLFLFLWLRATLPRLRFDQLMHLGWKVLIPIALANLLVTSIVVYAIRN